MLASAATVIALTVVAIRPAGADGIQVHIEGGRVTLVATEAPLTEVLAAWSRAGGTRFVDAEVVAGETVTLHLVEVTEGAALRTLLRPAAGYVAAPRRAAGAGASLYDRVKILGGRRLRPAGTARAEPARDGPAAAVPPGPDPMPLDDLQRLLDAVSGTTGGVREVIAAESAPPGVSASPPLRPVRTTPFPGMVVESEEP